MLIFTCIVILKYRGRKYRGLSAILVVMILFFLFFLVKRIYKFVQNREDIIQTEEWVNVLDFSNTLEIIKTGKLQSYPEVTILSDINGEILSMNVVTGDIVDEYDILMQIKNIDGISSDYDDVDEMINVMNDNYIDLEKEYKEFQLENGDKIKKLEKQLYNNQNALIQAMELNDEEGRKILENEISDLSVELNELKLQQENLENGIKNLKSEIQLVRNESDKYYSELKKQTPRAPFRGVVGNVYFNEGESVRNGDKLITIINNSFTPDISVSLDFNEYLLTKDLKGVTVLLENDNWGNFEYSGNIYTRSPILNDEGKYTIIVRTIGEVSDLILGDDNSDISVIFNIDSTLQWIPNRCFKKIGDDNGILTLRDGDVIVDKDVLIKSKWNGWNNVELKLYSLEKEEEKDGIQLCVDDWNKGVIQENDVDVINWYNQFETVEEFCGEFIKINPMYGENRNLAIVSELGGNGEIIEVLCDIE